MRIMGGFMGDGNGVSERVIAHPVNAQNENAF